MVAIARLQFFYLFAFARPHWNVFYLVHLVLCYDLPVSAFMRTFYFVDEAESLHRPVSLKIKNGISNQDCTIAIAVRQFLLRHV